MHISIIRVYLSSAQVNRHEYWLYTTCGLSHKARCASRSDSQTSNISATILHHVGIQLSICILQAVDERIVSLAAGIVNLECAALLSHSNRRTISIQCQCLVNRNREVGSLLCTISQSESCQHITFGSNAYASTTSHTALLLYLLPKMVFGTLHLVGLWILLYLLQYEVYLLHLKVHDIIHQSLRKLHMLSKLIEIERCLWSKWIVYIAIEIDAEQTTRVVRAQWNLATWICAHGTEAKVGIAVRDALSDDGIPEQHSWFCTLPCVVHYLLPKVVGRNLLLYLWII